MKHTLIKEFLRGLQLLMLVFGLAIPAGLLVKYAADSDTAWPIWVALAYTACYFSFMDIVIKRIVARDIREQRHSDHA